MMQQFGISRSSTRIGAFCGVYWAIMAFIAITAIVFLFFEGSIGLQTFAIACVIPLTVMFVSGLICSHYRKKMRRETLEVSQEMMIAMKTTLIPTIQLNPTITGYNPDPLPSQAGHHERVSHLPAYSPECDQLLSAGQDSSNPGDYDLPPPYTDAMDEEVTAVKYTG